MNEYSVFFCPSACTGSARPAPLGRALLAPPGVPGAARDVGRCVQIGLRNRSRLSRLAVSQAVLFVSGCVGSMNPAPISTTPEATGDYEVSGAIYHAEFYKGAPYIEQERDNSGQVKLLNGSPVEVELVFFDAAGVEPKIVVSRDDGAEMGVGDEATALRVASVLCADKGRRPMKPAGSNSVPPPATSVLEEGKWGVFALCR